LIAQFADVRVTEEGVLVKVDFGVEAEQVSRSGQHQWVDLEQGAVGIDKRLVEVHQQWHRLLDLGDGKAELEGYFAGLKSGQSDDRIDRFEEKFFGSLGRDFLDVHTALGRRHQGDHVGGAVDQERDVEFVGDVTASFAQDSFDDLAFWSGLVGDQSHAEHFAGILFDLISRLGNLDAAALAASAGMNLCLDCVRAVAEALGPVAGRVAVVDDVSFWKRNPEVPQNCLGLVLVNIHGCLPSEKWVIEGTTSSALFISGDNVA